MSWVHKITYLLLLLYTGARFHQSSNINETNITRGSVRKIRFEEEISHRLPFYKNPYLLPKGLLENLHRFFVQRLAQSGMRLANQVLRVPYAEMVLLAIDNYDDELFDFLMQYSTPEELNKNIDSYPMKTLVSYLCSKRDSMKTFKYFYALVGAGANLTSATDDGSTPFLIAVESRNTLAIDYIIWNLQRLLPKNNFLKYLSEKNSNGTSPLYAATINRDSRTVHMLLDLGVNPNTTSPDGKRCMLPLAVRHSSMDLIQHLLVLDVDVRGLNSERLNAMSIALRVYRPAAQREILNKMQLTFNAFNHLPEGDRRRTRPEDTITRLFFAMKSGVSEEVVLALLRLELESENRHICSTFNEDGGNIFHTSLRYNYLKVVERLTTHYSDNPKDKTKEKRKELCYADSPDRYGFYPSELIMINHCYKEEKDKLRSVLDLFYSLSPHSKLNSLREVILDPIGFEAVYYNAHLVQELFGPEILRMTDFNSHGEDLLRLALNENAPDSALFYICYWLSRYAAANSKYQHSIARNLYYFSGNDPSSLIRVGSKIENRLLYIVYHMAPAIVFHLLTTVFIKTTQNEAAYRNLVFNHLHQFPPMLYSPLSHAVRCLLHPKTEILTADLALELLGSHYYDKFLPQHYMNALEFIGNASSVPSFEIAVTFSSTNTSGLHRQFDIRGKPYGAFGFLLPIIGSEHLVLGDKLLKQPVNPASLSYRERKRKMLYAILFVPKTKVHPFIQTISMQVVILSAIILFFTLTFIAAFFFENDVLNEERTRHFNWIPIRSYEWHSAFLAGLSKVLDIPRYTGRIRLIRQKHQKLSVLIHTIYCIALTLRCCCSLYYILEVYFITTYYIRKSSQTTAKMTIASPLWFIQIFTLIVYAVMVRYSVKRQATWLNWIIFGFPSFMKLGSNKNTHEAIWNSVMRQLHWKPLEQRLRTTLELTEPIINFAKTETTIKTNLGNHRNLALAAVKSEKNNSMRLTGVEESAKQSIQETPKIAWLNKKYKQQMYTSYQQSRNSVEECVDVLKTKKKTFETHESILYQRYVLQNCIKEFKVTFGHARDAFIIAIGCFLIVQFPFWRCFKQFKLLNFDVYFSNTKFVSYMTQPSLSLIRELAVLIACWTQLVHLLTPLVCALRFAAAYRRISKVFLLTFPLRNHLLTSCNPRGSTASKKQKFNSKACYFHRNISKGTQYKNHLKPNALFVTKRLVKLSHSKNFHRLQFHIRVTKRKYRARRTGGRIRKNGSIHGNDAFPLHLLHAYLDIRQTIYAQLEFAYQPLHTTMHVTFLCAVFHIAWFSIQLQKRDNPQRVVVDQILRFAGFQTLVFIVIINWFVFAAATANNKAIQGHEILKEIFREFEGRTNTAYKRLLNQAGFHFSKTEFRISLVGVNLTPGHSVVIFGATLLFLFLLLSTVLNDNVDLHPSF